MDKTISIEQGNGGKEMNSLLNSFFGKLYRGENWENFTNDSATYSLPNGDTLCFTTDSFVVNPIEFPGGNIGHLAVSGTLNDICVMGADPIGLSLSFILEEGLEVEIFEKVVESISNLSEKFKVPIVTGDTKVMEKGAVDKLVVNVSGVGICKRILDDEFEVGDKIIVSGGIGEHGVALLSQRFDFETEIISDSNPVCLEMKAIRDKIKFAKDPTRGGISAVLNEVAKEKKVLIEIDDTLVPIKKEVRVATKLLGLDPLELANEGRILAVVSNDKSDEVLEELKKFNDMAQVIGEIVEKNLMGKVILKTSVGKRILSEPSGKIVPRIC